MKNIYSNVRVRIAACLVILCATFTSSMAAPPDLTDGGVPNEDPAITINLGPTGARGWVYHVKVDTSESRQILVTAVDAGSPAAGLLAAGDVILGANGTGANPSNFTSDARKSLALAIADAEVNSPAELKLLRWQPGTTSTSTVTLTLQTMGAYSATAPYNCPKSTKILEDGLQYVYNNESSGRYSFGAITLLATGNATYEAKAQTEARALIPSQSTMDQMMSDERDASSMITWQRGHTLVFLTEYYLATNDAQVLPAIEAYAVNIAKNRSLFGTVGHIFAEKNDDGSANGPMGGVYGVVNSAGMPCFLGVLLAKECGLTNPELDPAIEASTRFFAYYAGKGAIPYGEHEPYIAHESNGKSGLGALYFGLQNDRVEEGKFFAKMATASTNERELGHTGAWFNYLWAPLGAAQGGEEAAAAYFSQISWMLDLNRRWDGGFDYDCLNGEGPNSGSSYHDFRMSTAALLTYALPERKLRITGKGYDGEEHDDTRWLTSPDVIEAVAAGDYDADSRSDSELITDLGNWSPKVRKQAAQKLGTRSIDSSELSQITAMANDTGASSRSRAGACLALGEIGDSSSAAPLAALLTDADRYVRYSAAEAMRYLPSSAKRAQVDTILAAAASTAEPLYPMVEEDPLQFAHAKLGMLLFYSWSSFGPKGILYNSVDGIDRDLLYPAIRAVSETPVGLSRGTLEKTYDNLTYEDVLAVSGSIVDSITNRAPADKMFSNGVRRGGVAVLRKHGFAEGVPTCMSFVSGEAGGRRKEGLQLLGTFGGGVHTVEPDPDAIAFLTSYLSDNETAATAQTSLDQIAADSNPTPLVALKSIQSATADAPTVTLPANFTTLRVTAIDHAQGDSIYTWQKVSGSGAVSFTPNGTAAALVSTVQFSDTPGNYEFEVTMSDSRGLTETYKTVSVVLVAAPPVSAPDVVGLTQSAAQSAITSAGLTLGSVTTESSPSVPTGSVISQNPAGGTSVLSGTSVDLVVSSGSGSGSPLKVFILVGQSNMEGHGEMDPVETQGTLEYLFANDPAGTYGHLKDEGSWTIRDDVWMWYKRAGTTLLTGGLSAGFGANADTIGPELQFGHVMGDALGEQVLIIKTAWGGKSLAVDFRPPSSGWTVSPPVSVGDQGYYYQEMLNYVSEALGDLSTFVPGYDSEDGYELAGFGWHQGWNDRVNQTHNDEYEANMENFIKDVRNDLGAPGLPFVIATTGMSGWTETHPRALSLMAAQLAMEDFTTYPDFDGNVAVVETRGFYRDAAVSPANQGYHWNRNAETHFLIGQAMAQEMQTLIAGGDVTPPTPNPPTFAVAPAADSDTAISMTATTGSDASGPVEYLFTETSGNPGGASSNWQTSPTYTNSGLSADTAYAYTVTMRDTLGNTGTPSAVANVNVAPDLVGELGILDLTANGGVNPNTGNPWLAGDQYRLAFHTVGATGTLNGTSNAPAVYNAYVTAEAQANTALAGSSWFAMVTVNLDGGTTQELSPKSHVKDNTGTADLSGGAGIGGAGFPVFAMDGTTCIARNNADIWDEWSNPFDSGSKVRTGSVHYSPFLDQFGNQTVNVDANHGIDVATGASESGSHVNALGNTTDITTFSRGNANANSAGRVWNRYTDSTSTNRSFYALSAPLTVEAASPSNNFSNWIGGYTLVDASFNGDDDDDGLANGIEAFFGTDPSVANPGLAMVSQSGSLTTFTHPVAEPPLDDVTGSYQWSLDLVNWHPSGTVGATTVTIMAAAPVGGITNVTADTTGSSVTPTQLYIRVLATEN
jgi:hypothetical protein